MVFVALLICNLGGANKILNGNIRPLFDYQILREDNDGGKMLITSNIQLISGIDDIVPIPEKGISCRDTEQGTLEFDLYPPVELPLHFEVSDLSEWTGEAVSYGGYEPYDGVPMPHKIKLWQKDEVKGYVLFDWVLDESSYVPSNTWTYNAVFHTLLDSGENVVPYISLDSNKYPELSSSTLDWSYWLYDKTPGDKIPGKEVELKMYSWWQGCEQQDQSFLVLSVRANHQFSQN